MPGMSPSLEVSAFVMEQVKAQMTEQRVYDQAQRQEMEAKLEKQREETETQRQDYEAKLRDYKTQLQAQRQEYETKLEAQRHEYEEKLEAQRQGAKICLLDSKLRGLQERLDALHQAKLLSDDEMFALEDKLADFIECRSVSVVPKETDMAKDNITKLVGLFEGVSKDEMLARQLRRKLL